VPGRPLLVTADPTLLDELLRLAAAAGVDPDVAADMAAARPHWSGAALVVLGADLAEAAVRHGLPRRPDVVLVGRDLDDAEIWGRAVDAGAETVMLLPDAQSMLVNKLGESVDRAVTASTTVAVVGGRGGAGASTFATALALTGARSGLQTMLVDGDPLGGGIDLLVGGEDTRGLRWPDLVSSEGRVNGRDLRDSLLDVGDLRVLSWDRGDALTIPAPAMRSVLAAAGRTSELVVVDLPRRIDAAAEVALAAAAHTLLVVPAELRAVAAAARVAAGLGRLTDEVRVVVRGPAPGGLTAALVADSLALPLAGWLRPEPGLEQALERGVPPARGGRGPLARLCQQVLDELVGPGAAAA
jgi:secretion/DNA translocation related CpaE-like protein